MGLVSLASRGTASNKWLSCSQWALIFLACTFEAAPLLLSEQLPGHGAISSSKAESGDQATGQQLKYQAIAQQHPLGTTCGDPAKD